jgi:hypothetical protein
MSNQTTSPSAVVNVKQASAPALAMAPLVGVPLYPMAVVVVQLTEEWRIEGAGAVAAQAAEDTATAALTANAAAASDGHDERRLASLGPSPTLRSMGPVVETVNKVRPNTVGWSPRR